MVSSRRKEKVRSSTIASVIMVGIGAILSGGGIYSFSYGFAPSGRKEAPCASEGRNCDKLKC